MVSRLVLVVGRCCWRAAFHSGSLQCSREGPGWVKNESLLRGGAVYKQEVCVVHIPV